MNQAVLSIPRRAPLTGESALGSAVVLWFAIASVGQWFFAASLLDAARDSITASAHLAFTLTLLVCGPLQFAGALRARLPALHRVLGRTYLAATLGAALTGGAIVLERGTQGDLSMHIGYFFNVLLVVCCAAMTWHSARTGEFAQHRVWVLRLFLVANAAWFFRLGLILWLAVNGEPVGFDVGTFSGPFLSALAFAQTLLPLALLQVYLFAEARGGAALRLGVALGLTLITGATAFAVFLANPLHWLPRIVGAL